MALLVQIRLASGVRELFQQRTGLLGLLRLGGGKRTRDGDILELRLVDCGGLVLL